MPVPFRLDGRRALVTGGASGIGEAVCRVLAAAGALVTIADIDRAMTISRKLVPKRLDDRLCCTAVTEKPGAHVVVNADDGPAFEAQRPNALRAN